MISIIIPSYNHKEALARTLDSIRAQSYRDYEVIVVDDGSTDQTASLFQLTDATRLDKNGVVAFPPLFRGRRGGGSPLGGEIRLSFGNLPILYIHQENQGANATRNRGFQSSKGEHVLFCDADVRMRPGMLERMHRTLIEHPEASYVYSSFKFGFKEFRLWPFDGPKLKQMPYIHTTSLIRRAHFPGFDPAIRRLQDWDLFLTMLSEEHVGTWIPELLFEVETRKNGMSEWLPSFAYAWLPFLPAVKKYKRAERIIKQKHQL